MAAVLQRCPSCGVPVASGAVFCENCGKRLQAGGASSPSEPNDRASSLGETHGASKDGSHGVLAPLTTLQGFGRSNDPTIRRSDDSTWPQAALDSDAPFVFEWDEARQFVAGVAGVFAYRMRFRCDLNKVEFVADVGGEPLEVDPFFSVRAGEEREGAISYGPKSPGRIKINLCVNAEITGRVRESFKPTCPLSNDVLPDRPTDVIGGDGNLTVNINAADSIIRQEGMNIGGFRRETVDIENYIKRVLHQPPKWREVAFASCEECGRETVRLCDGKRTLEVVAGTDSVTFGRSSRRAAVRLVPAGTDGQPDDCRGRFVSGVHFTFVKSGSSVLLRDGGPDEDAGRKGWRKSSNGLTLDGRMATSDQTLSPGRTVRAVIAPYSVPGGALAVTLEARGQDGCISGCDRSCELASVAIRREDSPDRAAIVVWGSADIGELLGSGDGLRVGLVRGRLRLIRPDGSSVRLIHLVGGAVPGTGISVQ